MFMGLGTLVRVFTPVRHPPPAHPAAGAGSRTLLCRAPYSPCITPKVGEGLGRLTSSVAGGRRPVMASTGPILLAEDDDNDVFLLRRAFDKAGLADRLIVVRN